ncbi:uncharacterized protein F4807DRAFT_324298 [Annulohypoxylon truncatum]|uniref:uncharacterized protein n=1 Tax=Annulohypoxylon truncatum TaxID=327061 RepID=UPI00200825FB|nr:uncharacterized protein F4807DRAFT_324298 [Annulohypoxylon truncatum]KAI1204672.1 hypothetical protein F4807DRAFT_324298 [Annulohypoxylon truncatum]
MDTVNLTSSSSPAFAPASGTAPTKSPSDLSYTSSGASPSLSTSHHTSRHTSPDSITVTHSSSPSQQSALVDITSTVDLHCNPNFSLPKTQHKMDRNPFQSVNERRNKLATDHNSGTSSPIQQQHQTQQSPSQPHFPSQVMRSNMQQQQQQLTLSSRGLASSNWRSQGGAADDQAYASSSSRGSSGEYASAFESIPPPLSLSMNAHPASVLRQQTQQTPTYLSPRAEHFPQHQLDFMSAATNHNAGAGMGAGMGAGVGAVEGATASPTGTYFPNMQLDGIYAYCFDRGNGQYTRLVPADMLPPLKDVPALQQGCAGMMVLPLPRGLPQNGRSTNTDMVMLKTPPNTPGGPSDTIQSRIDTIVASTPPTPPHHQHSLSGSTGGLGLGATTLTTPGTGGGAGGSGGQGPHGHAQSYSQSFDNTNNNSVGNGNGNGNNSHGGRNASGGQGAHGGGGHGHGHGHNGSGSGGGSGAGGQQPQRRPKVYCDKWVHEGVCAFTQQGCKYKHEMPFDKVTQHALGLFHGFPAWWKKHQADLSRQREGPGPAVPSTLGLGMGAANGGAGGAGMSGLGITAGVGGMGAGGDGTQELTGLNASRFMARGGAPGAGAGSGPSSAGVGAGIGFVEGKGDGAGMASSPTTPGLPSWRRGGEHHSSEQKPMGTGRGMTRGVPSGMRNPLVSYGSPFGPIAPPPRTFSTGPPATANPYSSLESLDESNTTADNGEEEGPGETSRSSGARLS